MAEEFVLGGQGGRVGGHGGFLVVVVPVVATQAAIVPSALPAFGRRR
jgi:hypothetical protein